MKHTPGPWTAIPCNEAGNINDIVNADGYRAAGTFGRTPEEQEANARLIAAAPDLLAACDELLEGMIPGEKHNTANVTLYAIGMIREAIRKATTI